MLPTLADETWAASEDVMVRYIETTDAPKPFSRYSTGGRGRERPPPVTAYVTSPAGVPIYRQMRDRMLEGAEPASTLQVVSELADPKWHVEIQVVAAAAT